MQESELIQCVARLRKLEAKGREVKVEVDGIRALLREEFDRQGTDEIKAGRYHVRRLSYDRETFDTSRFRVDHPKVYKLYCKPSTVSRIEVAG